MPCPRCQLAATTERVEQMSLAYRTFAYHRCYLAFNKRTITPFNSLEYATDIIFLVVLWRLRYKLSLRHPGVKIAPSTRQTAGEPEAGTGDHRQAQTLSSRHPEVSWPEGFRSLQPVQKQWIESSSTTGTVNNGIGQCAAGSLLVSAARCWLTYDAVRPFLRAQPTMKQAVSLGSRWQQAAAHGPIPGGKGVDRRHRSSRSP